MTSFTASFTGTSSILRADFFPEIILDPNSNYSCGLLDFTSYNSIPNIIEGINNKFIFNYTANEKVKNKINGKEVTTTVTQEKQKTISLSTGAYEIADILHYIKSQLASVNINLTYDVNVATSKVKLIFDAQIVCIDDSVLSVLGFKKQNSRKFESKRVYWSDDIIKVTNIDVIRIECDIVSGSYINGKHCHTIHQFSHCKVNPGYKFIEVPQHIVYLPVREKRLRSIQISIVDQNDNPIDFRGEQISCRIHIKKSG